MAYAVTCKSCGARFSVASDLVQKRIGSEPVALRCKRCHEPIVVRASQPPEALPAKAPPARPRPPLKKQPIGVTDKAPELAKPARPAPPPRPKKAGPGSIVALGRGLLPERADFEKDLFDAAPPPSNREAIDLSEMAHSEPPSHISSAPPLFDLAHTGPVNQDSASHEDVDFFLGLRGSPGTAAALQSPSFEDLMKKPPSEPPVPITVEEPSTETPAAVALPKSAVRSTPPAPEPRRRKAPALTLALAALGISGVVLAANALTHRSAPEVTNPSPAPSIATALSSEPAPQASAEAPVARAEPEAPISKPLRTTAPSASRVPKAEGKPTTPSTVAPVPAPARETPASAPRPAARAEPRELVGAGFDRSAAVSTLNAQAAQAAKCRKDGDPSGTANITITFAPSGRVTSANLSGPPFAGTPTGGCIAAALRRARVPAFDGDSVTVSKTVVIQ